MSKERRRWAALSNGPDFPFYIHDVGLSKAFELSGHADPAPICQLIADSREGYDQESTARLIAAAPEMLEALEAALFACEKLHYLVTNENERLISVNNLATLQWAIAKARGAK